MPTYRTEAIILKRKNFSESDKILTIFSQKKGKISVIVKGARRLKSRKGGNLDLLNYCDLLIARGKNLDLVLEAQAKNSFLPLKKNLGKISFAYLGCEIIDLLSAEQVENNLLFSCLRSFLENLSVEDNNFKQRLLLLSFQLKVFNLLGFFSEILLTSKKEAKIAAKLIGNDFGKIIFFDIDKESLDRLELIATKLFEEIAEKHSPSRNFISLVQKQ